MQLERTRLETSEDAVLGGRLRLRQPLSGHRVGHDAILLAAATGGQAGDKAADLGAGVGAAGLALAARVDGLFMTLVEIEESLSALAAENAARNGFGERVRALSADACDGGVLAAGGLAPGSLDRVLMNPPFNDPSRQRLSPDPMRRLAHAAPREDLAHWVASAADLLKDNGTLTLIWRADGHDDVLAALTPRFGAVAVLPVLPDARKPAIRVLVRARKGPSVPLHTLPPLALNDDAGRPSKAAEAVLRGGEALPLAAG